jgi:hypothetical protein
VYFATGRVVQGVPRRWALGSRDPNPGFRSELARLDAALARGALVAYFRPPRPHSFPEAEFLARFPVTVVFRDSTGTLYRVRAGSAPLNPP